MPLCFGETASPRRLKICASISRAPKRRDPVSRPDDAVERPVERLADFQPEFREDLRWWTREQPRVADRIWALIEEVMRNLFGGTGKPEK